MMEMDYFTIQATSYREAMSKVQDKYGPNAQIISQRTIRMGGFMGIMAKEGVEVSGYIKKETPKKKVLGLEEEKKRFMELGKIDQATVMTQILAEVKSLKTQMNDKSNQNTSARQDHEAIIRMGELLESNEFSSRYAKKMLQRLKNELTLEDLDDWNLVQDRMLEWIGESINVFEERGREKPQVFILVGPTGVGKTTTIAKLAAKFGIAASGASKKKVRIITIDNYRIGARHQIETFGEIMGVPVNCAETAEDLRKFMAYYQDVDVIFIDTIGKSPKDYEKIGQMRVMLKECGANPQVHLALSATTKGSDMVEIAQQFEPFNYRSVVLTKLDETNKVGSVISTLSEKQKSISYITTGQVVPHDIEAASVIRLLCNLEGFRVNRDRLEQRFLQKKADYEHG